LQGFGAIYAQQAPSPVEIQSDAKTRVAFDLMNHISRREEGKEQEQKTRAYWLTLYAQCHKATRGDRLEYVLEPK
jgi:hypothetical protein